MHLRLHACYSGAKFGLADELNGGQEMAFLDQFSPYSAKIVCMVYIREA